VKRRYYIGIGALLVVVAVHFALAGTPHSPLESQTPARSPATVAPIPIPEGQFKDWMTYHWENISFKYPSDWQVEPQLYRTPSQEAEGKPSSVVGLWVFPKDTKTSGTHGIGMGGRQMDCDVIPAAKGRCFTLYGIPIYTYAQDSETLQVFDLLLRTVRYDNPDAPFEIIFPTAQGRIEPNTRCTIRWRTKHGFRIHSVTIQAWDTSQAGQGSNMVFQVTDVPNTGNYDWLVPGSLTSSGPYIIGVYFVKLIKVPPGALSAGQIYEGLSDPFYIY
jgi:hypothetical protein